MNQKFASRLDTFLKSECSDYDLTYSWEWVEDYGCVEAIIGRDGTKQSKTVRFKYDYKNDDLRIELCEDSYYVTREFDQTVKHFWMLIAPTIFPNA